MFKRTATLFAITAPQIVHMKPKASPAILKKIRSAIAKSTQKINAGDWQIAQALLKSTIENYIEKYDSNEAKLDREVYFLHGMVSELRGAKNVALTSFEKSLKIDPNDIKAKQHIESIKYGRLEFPSGTKIIWIPGSHQAVRDNDNEIEQTPSYTSPRFK